jgi:3-oxoadipate enol-lactonase
VEAFDDREVIVPRLPLELDAAVQITLRALDENELVDLGGLSLGALVALRAALERPRRVRRLVLAAGFARLPRRLRVLQLAVAAAARVMPRRVLVRGLASSIPATHRVDAERELAAISSAEVARLMRAGARFDVAAAARHLQIPTLVVCGERDRHNLTLSRDLAALLPRAEPRVIPDAGHVVNLEQPEAFNAIVRSFLEADDAANAGPIRTR